MAQQLFTLNTNIRYLHEKLVLHAEKLTSTMPPALEVRSLTACVPLALCVSIVRHSADAWLAASWAVRKHRG